MNEHDEPEREPEYGYLRQTQILACAVDDIAMTDSLLRMYCCLGSYAHKRNDQWCWPSQAKLADRMGISRQQAGQLLSRLAELGYIEIRAHFRPDGGKASSSYRLILDFQLPAERDRGSIARPRQGIGGRGRKGGTHETPGVSSPMKVTHETPGVSSHETPGVSSHETPGVSSNIGRIRKKNTEEEYGRRARPPSIGNLAIAAEPEPEPDPPPEGEDWPPDEPEDEDWPPLHGEIYQNIQLLKRWAITAEAREFMRALDFSEARMRYPRDQAFAYVEWQRQRRAVAASRHWLKRAN